MCSSRAPTHASARRRRMSASPPPPWSPPSSSSSIFRRGYWKGFRKFSMVFSGFRGLPEVLGGPRRLPEAPEEFDSSSTFRRAFVQGIRRDPEPLSLPRLDEGEGRGRAWEICGPTAFAERAQDLALRIRLFQPLAGRGLPPMRAKGTDLHFRPGKQRVRYVFGPYLNGSRGNARFMWQHPGRRPSCSW